MISRLLLFFFAGQLIYRLILFQWKNIYDLLIQLNGLQQKIILGLSQGKQEYLTHIGNGMVLEQRAKIEQNKSCDCNMFKLFLL